MASRTRFFPLIAALLLALGALPAATAPTHVARAMGTTTAPYGYMEYLPSAYYDDPSARCPLVLFLHGLGEEGPGTDPVALKSAICRNSSPHDQINRGTAIGLRFNTENAICLGPQTPGWWSSATIHQFLAYAYATYPRIDRTRVYVTGLSMGGGGTWDYVAAHGEDVAACIPCCGASSPGSGVRTAAVATWCFHAWDDSTVTRQNSIDWSNEVARCVAGLAARTDVMATYPYGDGSSTVAASIETARFTAAGSWSWVAGVDAASGPSPKLTLYTSGNHSGGWTPTYNNSQVWDWLFAQRRTTGNTAPTISAIADRSIPRNGSTGAIAFTVGDAQTAAGSLTLTAASSNHTLVPVANVVFGGSGANRTVTVTPATDQTGSATVTVTVSDGTLTASEPFLLTVTAVADTTPPATPAAPLASSATSATPVLSGTTEAGATVSIYDDGVLIGSVAANGAGAWSWTVAPALAPGTHHLTVVASDAARNRSAASPATVVTVAATAGATASSSGGGSAGGSCGAGGLAGLLLAAAGLRRRRPWSAAAGR